ncbi:MAG: RDD family protein [Pseudomonadales bacterium]|nr:RDD family protein [Pseudomonadales bacterium]
MDSPSTEAAGFWRRMAAMFYDGFLIVSIWFISAIILVALNNGEEINGKAFQLFLYFEAGLFYTYFWHFKGQTLGMQVWKIRTINDTGEILTLSECVVRVFFATFSLVVMGLGYVWILFDPEKLAWHDRASGTRVIYLGKDAYKIVSDPSDD